MPVELSNALDEPWLGSLIEEKILLRSDGTTFFCQLSEYVWSKIGKKCKFFLTQNWGRDCHPSAASIGEHSISTND